MFLALGIQHALRMRHIVLCGQSGCTIFFPHYLINRTILEKKTSFFFPQCHHMSLVDLVVLRPGHGRGVTDCWDWDPHETHLCCPDDVWVVIEGDVVPGGALNINSTNLPRPWSPRESSPSRKIPTVEPEIEPGISWLVVRDSDHQTTRLVRKKKSYWIQNVFWFSLQLLSETFHILRRNERDMVKNVNWSPCKVSVILVRF